MDLETLVQSIMLGPELVDAVFCFSAGIAAGYTFSKNSGFHLDKKVMEIRGKDMPDDMLKKLRFSEKLFYFCGSLALGSLTSLVDHAIRPSVYRPFGTLAPQLAGFCGAYLGMRLGNWFGVRRRLKDNKLSKEEEAELDSMLGKLSDAVVTEDSKKIDNSVKIIVDYLTNIASKKVLSPEYEKQLFNKIDYHMTYAKLYEILKDKIDNVKEENLCTASLTPAIHPKVNLYIANIGKAQNRGEVIKLDFDIHKINLMQNYSDESPELGGMPLNAGVFEQKESNGFEWDTSVKDLCRIIAETREKDSALLIAYGDTPVFPKILFSLAKYADAYENYKKENN